MLSAHYIGLFGIAIVIFALVPFYPLLRHYLSFAGHAKASGKPSSGLIFSAIVVALISIFYMLTLTDLYQGHRQERSFSFLASLIGAEQNSIRSVYSLAPGTYRLRGKPELEMVVDKQGKVKGVAFYRQEEQNYRVSFRGRWEYPVQGYKLVADAAFQYPYSAQSLPGRVSIRELHYGHDFNPHRDDNPSMLKQDTSDIVVVDFQIGSSTQSFKRELLFIGE